MTVTIHITGPEAGAIATELESALAPALTVTPTRKNPAPEGGTARAVDPVAVAALILSIPGAVLATLDLAERARLGERIDTLLARLRERAKTGNSVMLSAGAKPPLNLAAASRDAVLDALERRPTDTD